jgi:hypothetical protein
MVLSVGTPGTLFAVSRRAPAIRAGLSDSMGRLQPIAEQLDRLVARLQLNHRRRLEVNQCGT